MTIGNLMIKMKRSVLAEQATQIIGEQTNEVVEKLQVKLANIAMKFETGAFSGGDKCRHT